MKKNIPILFLVFGLSTLPLFWTSCDIEEKVEEQITTYDFLVKSNGKEFSIKTDVDLVTFIKHVATHKNITVESATFEEMTDEDGVFNVIKGKYKLQDDRVVSIAVPLKLIMKKRSNYSQSFEGDCTMTCTPKNGCDGCNQTITRQCAGQICSCNPLGNIPGQNGTCDSSIKFLN